MCSISLCRILFLEGNVYNRNFLLTFHQSFFLGTVFSITKYYTFLMRISLFMKTVQTLSLRRTTSDICSPSPSQRKDSAHLLFYVIGSLSSDSLREATCIFLIGRDFSRDFARGRETTGTYDSWYNTAKSRHCIIQIPLSEERRFHARISRTSTNQQDSLKSARSSRISKILSNRQDYLESSRLSNPTDTCHGFLSSSHRPPQLSTA